MSENVKMARQALDAYQSKPEFDSHGFAHHPLGDRDLGSSNAAVLYSGKYKKLYDENGVLRDTMRERIAIFDDGSLLAYKEYAGSKFQFSAIQSTARELSIDEAIELVQQDHDTSKEPFDINTLAPRESGIEGIKAYNNADEPMAEKMLDEAHVLTADEARQMVKDRYHAAESIGLVHGVVKAGATTADLPMIDAKDGDYPTKAESIDHDYLNELVAEHTPHAAPNGSEGQGSMGDNPMGSGGLDR